MDMYDAVDWENIPKTAGAVMGYIDGPRSRWPAEAWVAWRHVPTATTSVLADPAALVMDVEQRNATLAQALNAAATRLGRGQPTVIYCERSTLPEVAPAVRLRHLPLLPASSWPWPGVYLHVADPGTPPHLDIPEAPVAPVAVQYEWAGTYDISICAGDYPSLALAVTPAGEDPAVPELNADIVAAVPTTARSGVWLVASDGGVFALGGAPAFDNPVPGIHLARPIVAAYVPAGGVGLVLVGGDGGFFPLGGATVPESLPGLGETPAPEQAVEH